MFRNLELKARVDNIDDLERRVAGFADSGPTEIMQDDTFFQCVNGRLKLRTFSEDLGELIFYQRVDEAGPKESFYLRSPTSTPAVMRESLTLAYGEAGRVQKRRTLFVVGRTRIHLDRVKDLGSFLELEVVLRDDESVDCGINEANEILQRLNVNASQLVEGAYADLARWSDA